MSREVLQQIDYHAGRAIEELERANGTSTDVERSSHMELSRLHLYRAGWLRAAHDDEIDRNRPMKNLLSSALLKPRAGDPAATWEPAGSEAG